MHGQSAMHIVASLPLILNEDVKIAKEFVEELNSRHAKFFPDKYGHWPSFIPAASLLKRLHEEMHYLILP